MKRHFNSFPYTTYVTDVTFQQAYRPSGSMSEGKAYYIGKPKLYGYKTEMSVLPIRLAINCANHCPGSVSDLESFQKKVVFIRWLQKCESQRAKNNYVGVLSDEYEHLWALFLDNGYQGVQEILRGIIQ